MQALQVLNAAGDWIQASPKPGTFVVNIGDQLQRITSMSCFCLSSPTVEKLGSDVRSLDGVFKSTVHRAINRTGQDRMSMPFFFGLDYDAMLETLPSCITADRPAKYEPITAGAYVEKRMKETYVRPAEEVAATA